MPGTLFDLYPDTRSQVYGGIANARTSWYWNVRVGDKIRIGESGAFYTVVYVDRAKRRRIIAAWPSHRKERERWAGWSG